MGSLARRERRPVWGALSLLFAAGIGVCGWFGIQARADAIASATARAELVARTELAPLLVPKDLAAPVTGERAAEVTADISDTIVETGSADGVRLFSPLGRILYAEQSKIVGTRPSYLRDLTFRVSNGDAQSVVRGGQLLTYTPVWLSPDGPVAVAEVAAPLGPIVSGALAPWLRYGSLAGLLLVASLAMVVVTTRAPARRAAVVPLYAPSLRRPVMDPSPTGYADVRALDERREQAERKVHLVEENFHAVQKRLKDALARIEELEATLAVNEREHDTQDGDLAALRDQVRDQSRRLHEAELENNALRQRMALRHQELDEARRTIQEMRLGSFTEMRARLEAADAKVESLERQARRLESELERATTRVQMARLSDALRDVDGDEVEIEEVDELFEHPMIIRNATNHTTTPQKVR